MSGEGPGPAKCGICAMIERIKARNFPDFIAELKGSYVILGDQQFYRGYCVLFAKNHATELYLMPAADAQALFNETRTVAEAIASVARPWKMNYECLGNSEPHVHWHLFPRFATEADDLRRGPIWLRPEAERKAVLSANDRRELRAALKREILARIPDARLAAD